jgi:fucose permease
MLATVITIALIAGGITAALVPVLIGLVLQHRHDQARSARAAMPITKAAPVMPSQARFYEKVA